METNTEKAKKILNQIKAKDALHQNKLSIIIDGDEVSPLSCMPHTTEIGRIKITKKFHSNGQLDEITIEDKELGTYQSTEFDKHGNLILHNTIKKTEKLVGVSVGRHFDSDFNFEHHYDENGKFNEIRYKKFYLNGSIKLERDENLILSYYDNGQLEREYIIGESEKRYYPNGKLEMEFVVGEYQKVYDEKGILLYCKDFFQKTLK